MKTYNHFIDGQYVEPIGKQWMDTINPYTGKAWAKIPQGCAKDVDRAVAAAKHAMTEGPFSKMTATERDGASLSRLRCVPALLNGLAANVRGRRCRNLRHHRSWWSFYVYEMPGEYYR